MKSLILVLMAGVLIAAAGCTGGSSGADNATNANASKPNIDLSALSIKKGDKVVLDSPVKAIELTILLNVELGNMTSEYQKNTNSAVSLDQFITERKKVFFESYGLTEDAFNQYYMDLNNNKQIQEFLEKNEKYQKLLNDSSAGYVDVNTTLVDTNVQ